MLSSEGLPRPVVRVATITRRFQKFLLVGAIGLGVNQGVLFALVDLAGLAGGHGVANRDFRVDGRDVRLERAVDVARSGQGRILHRALLYGSINSGGLLINWLTLVSLHRMGMNYLIANLVGAGIAAVWNFSLNHALTWRR